MGVQNLADLKHNTQKANESKSLKWQKKYSILFKNAAHLFLKKEAQYSTWLPSLMLFSFCPEFWI